MRHEWIGVKSRFTRSTVLAATNILKGLGHAGFDRFLLELGLPDNAGEGTGLQARANSLARHLDNGPGIQSESGQQAIDLVVEKAAAQLGNRSIVGSGLANVSREQVGAFEQALATDGFRAQDGSLQRTLPVEIGLPDAEDQLQALLARHHLTVPAGHLQQALAAHGRGDWASANSQLRTFMESLFDELAVLIEPDAKHKKSGQERRTRLANVDPPLINRDLNEWKDNGGGFVNGLMNRLHPQGSHPGLSDEEDSTFRLHTVLLAARLFLARYDARVKT